MTKKTAILALALTVFSACTSSTPHGECIGLNGPEDPKLQYRYSGWNIAMGVIFFELIAPPIVVALDQLKCPVGPKVER